MICFRTKFITGFAFLSLLLTPLADLYSLVYYSSYGSRGYRWQAYPRHQFSYRQPYNSYYRGYYNPDYTHYNSAATPDLYYMYPTTAKFFGYQSPLTPRTYDYPYRYYYFVPGRP